MNNNILYNVRYLKVKQIHKNGKIAGYLTMVEKAYGIVVQLHYFCIPGYKVNETFSNPYKAYKFFDKVFSTENEYK